MKPSATTKPPTQLLTVAQAADRLAVSARHIWQLLSLKSLTAIRLARRATRIDAAEVEALIDAARRREVR